jgi:aspartate kinase
MAVVVQKYGGSSVADVARLHQVAREVVARHRAGDRLVVVVSAMGKTTDSLIAQARQVAPNPPRRELDMLVTAGERIAMALLSMAICEAGEQAISFTGSQSGIITDESHQNARIVEVRPYRLREELARGRIVIVAGYQGVSRAREITTLGRGGSDTTAVALAAALNAQACEIYSDVDGVYSADPNVCPQATLLRELRYETMQAMAAVGAKVLNADAVEFARRAGIKILARKTADASGRQTQVHAQAVAPSGVVAVVGAKAVTRLLGPAVDVSRLLDRLASIGARAIAFSANHALDMLVDRTGIAGKDPCRLAPIAEQDGLCTESVAAVSLVGSNLIGRPNVLARCAPALAQTGIQAKAHFCSETIASLVVAPEECDSAVRALHQAFFQS